MFVRVEQLYLKNTHLELPPPFFYIWLLAMLALLVVSIVIRRSCPIHARIGFLTIVVIFLIGLMEPAL
jgi:hypothetical protein